MNRKIIIGTRGSQLALWQAGFIERELIKINPLAETVIKTIKTGGDRAADVSLKKIEDKSFFTKEIEEELLSGKIDIAVHSMKDMPTELPENLSIASVPKRHNPEDVLIAREKGMGIQDLRLKAVVASGSLRRTSQLLNLRSDLQVTDIRGNVPTRIKKFLDSSWDAIILARAGVERLGLDEYISSVIPTDDILPAAAQGALAIEIKADRNDLFHLLRKIEDPDTKTAVTAERSFLRAVQGGCRLPVGAYAFLAGSEIIIEGFIGEEDGSEIFRRKISFPAVSPAEAGIALAEILIKDGAGRIIDKINERRQ